MQKNLCCRACLASPILYSPYQCHSTLTSHTPPSQQKQKKNLFLSLIQLQIIKGTLKKNSLYCSYLAYNFFSPQPSPSPFLLFFLWTRTFPILYYHTVSTQTISRLLSTSVSWKCLSPLNPIKMLFISIMMSHSHQYLKIRINLSLVFICCSMIHNIIMLVSSQSTVEVLKVLFFSCILYLLRT